MQVVVEEVQRLAESNAKLSLEAHRTEEDIVNTETALRNNLTMLRKTLQDEIQAKTSLANKMESEAEDFEKYKGDSSRKLSRVSQSYRVLPFRVQDLPLGLRIDHSDDFRSNRLDFRIFTVPHLRMFCLNYRAVSVSF